MKKENKSENTNIEDATETHVKIKDFNYLKESESDQVFAFSFSKNNRLKNSSIKDDNNIYSPDSDKYKYAICILLKDDQTPSSGLLKETLFGIKKNLKGLKNLNIESKEIMIFVFVNQIKGDLLIKKESIKEHLSNENKQKYFKTPLKYDIG